MKKKFKKFLKIELIICIVVIFVLLVNGCIHYKTFFMTPAQGTMTRDYLQNDISHRFHIKQEILKDYDNEELEIINRLGLEGMIALDRNRHGIKRLFRDLEKYQIFYDIIEEYGPHHVVPVLDYFYEEGNLSTRIELVIGEYINKIFRENTSSDSLTERQKRLLLILKEIEYQKHNFLSRFVFTSEGARRNYVTTVTSTVVNFFTGGLANFNAAVITRGIAEVTTSELLDAGIDILILIPFAAYLTKSAKPAVSGLKGGTLAGRAGSKVLVRSSTTVKATSRLGRISRGVLRVIPIHTLFRLRNVKWYILTLAIVKPDLINHAAALVANAVSVPPLVMKFGFWILILLPIVNILYVLYLIFRSIFRKFKRILMPVRS